MKFNELLEDYVGKPRLYITFLNEKMLREFVEDVVAKAVYTDEVAYSDLARDEYNRIVRKVQEYMNEV